MPAVRPTARRTGDSTSLHAGESCGGVGREALHDAAAAGRHAAANRADVGAAGRPQHEQFFARPHRPQHDHGGRSGAAAAAPAAAGAAPAAGAAAPPPLAAATRLAASRPKALPCSFPGIAAPVRRRSERPRRPSDSRSGRRCGSRKPARWSAVAAVAPARPLARRISALRSLQPQAVQIWPARLQPAWPSSLQARPALRPRAPRSGNSMRGSTCSSAGIAAKPRRPAARWSNAPCNRSGIAP